MSYAGRLAAHDATSRSADSPTKVQSLAVLQWAIGYVSVEWGILMGRFNGDEITLL
jgi:hypothetical protein